MAGLNGVRLKVMSGVPFRTSLITSRQTIKRSALPVEIEKAAGTEDGQLNLLRSCMVSNLVSEIQHRCSQCTWSVQHENNMTYRQRCNQKCNVNTVRCSTLDSLQGIDFTTVVSQYSQYSTVQHSTAQHDIPNARKLNTTINLSR